MVKFQNHANKQISQFYTNSRYKIGKILVFQSSKVSLK